MPDALDDVLQIFDKEKKEEIERLSRLDLFAATLANSWQPKIVEIARIYNEKLSSRYRVAFAQIHDDNKKIIIPMIRSNDRNEIAHLELEITEAGLVHCSAKPIEKATFQARDLPVSGDFPDEQVRKAMADFALFCLRSLRGAARSR